MKHDQENHQLPATGPTSSTLGVRVPADPTRRPDIDADDADSRYVKLNRKGMSVADHWSNLPLNLIPRRLRSRHLGATGADSLACWRMGEGDFTPGPINDTLELILKDHDESLGLVIPAQRMTIQDFQDALADTQPHWTLDESPP